MILSRVLISAWGVVNSGVFFMRFHCTLPIACASLALNNTLAILSPSVEVNCRPSYRSKCDGVRDVIKVNGQAAIPVTFCWGWIC